MYGNMRYGNMCYGNMCCQEVGVYSVWNKLVPNTTKASLRLFTLEHVILLR